MSDWRRRIERLLYDGESVQETVEFGATSVVVTSHRVLAVTPEMEGENLRQVERPNVAGVAAGARASPGLLERGLKCGVVGALLAAAGYVVDLDGLLGGVALRNRATTELGIGNAVGSLQGLLGLLTQLDQLLRAVGALALLLAVVLVGAYRLTRDETLVVEVAGGEDVHVPRPSDLDATADRLERAIAPEPHDGGDSDSAAPGDPPGKS